MCRFVCLSGAQVMIVEVDRPVGVVRRGRSGVRFSADQIGRSVTTFLRSCAVQCPCVTPRRWIRHLLHTSIKYREYNEDWIFWLVSAAVRIFCPVANLQKRPEKGVILWKKVAKGVSSHSSLAWSAGIPPAVLRSMFLQQMKTLDDQHVTTKHKQIYPTNEELAAVQKAVQLVEVALKEVSGIIHEQELKVSMASIR